MLRSLKPEPKSFTHHGSEVSSQISRIKICNFTLYKVLSEIFLDPHIPQPVSGHISGARAATGPVPGCPEPKKLIHIPCSALCTAVAFLLLPRLVASMKCSNLKVSTLSKKMVVYDLNSQIMFNGQCSNNPSSTGFCLDLQVSNCGHGALSNNENWEEKIAKLWASSRPRGSSMRLPKSLGTARSQKLGNQNLWHEVGPLEDSKWVRIIGWQRIEEFAKILGHSLMIHKYRYQHRFWCCKTFLMKEAAILYLLS